MEGGSERQTLSHASINLIEYLRYNLSIFSTRPDISSVRGWMNGLLFQVRTRSEAALAVPQSHQACMIHSAMNTHLRSSGPYLGTVPVGNGTTRLELLEKYTWPRAQTTRSLRNSQQYVNTNLVITHHLRLLRSRFCFALHDMCCRIKH